MKKWNQYFARSTKNDPYLPPQIHEGNIGTNAIFFWIRLRKKVISEHFAKKYGLQYSGVRDGQKIYVDHKNREYIIND